MKKNIVAMAIAVISTNSIAGVYQIYGSPYTASYDFSKATKAEARRCFFNSAGGFDKNKNMQLSHLDEFTKRYYLLSCYTAMQEEIERQGKEVGLEWHKKHKL